MYLISLKWDSIEESKKKFERGLKDLHKNNSDYKKQLESAVPFIGLLVGLSYER